MKITLTAHFECVDKQAGALVSMVDDWLASLPNHIANVKVEHSYGEPSAQSTGRAPGAGERAAADREEGLGEGADAGKAGVPKRRRAGKDARA